MRRKPLKFPPPREGYTVQQILRTLKVVYGLTASRRSIGYLKLHKIVVPSVQNEGRKGAAWPDLYTFHEFLQVLLIMLLRRRGGISLPAVRKLLAARPDLFLALRPDSRLALDVRGGVVLLRDIDS